MGSYLVLKEWVIGRQAGQQGGQLGGQGGNLRRDIAEVQLEVVAARQED